MKLFFLERNLKSTIKITPETYEEMNKHFEEEGTPLRIDIPTQKRIDDWQEVSKCSP